VTITLDWRDELAEDDADQVRALLLAARAVDGRPELTEDGPLPGELRGPRHLLARDASELVGYAHLDVAGDAFGRQVGELYVRPGRRRRGIGRAMLTELIDAAAPADADVAAAGPRIWSHTDHPGAAALAGRFGLRRVRELVRMRRDLGHALPEVRLPAGTRVRTFVPGEDDDAVIDINRRAFAWHPEQGALTVADLAAARREPWFDPAGFFLAVGDDDRVLGFHWTKIHPDGVGEVYVVGVDPDAHGGGLGTALTLAGLHHLRARGVPSVLLYVEGDNAAALAVYAKLGFQRWDVGVQYAR